MPLPHGIRFLTDRLNACQTTQQLRKLWGDIAYAYQRDPEVQAAKDRRKLELEKAGK